MTSPRLLISMHTQTGSSNTRGRKHIRSCKRHFVDMRIACVSITQNSKEQKAPQNTHKTQVALFDVRPASQPDTRQRTDYYTMF